MHQMTPSPSSAQGGGASLGPSGPSPAAAPTSSTKGGTRTYKLVVLGEGGVGKSALTLQFVNHRFIDYHDPTIEDAYQRQVVIDGEPAALDILDTAGQVEFTAMREQYMRCGEGFIICYSITERKSFEEALEYRKLIAKVRHADDIPLVLVGNKFDLETSRKVSQEEGQALARQYNCPFFETSAALRCYVDDVFHALVREIRAKEKERLNVAQNNHRRFHRWKGLKNIFTVIFHRRRTE